MSFFRDNSAPLGPVVSDALISTAEESLGVKLPKFYIALLREQNGGDCANQCFPVKHLGLDDVEVEVETLRGIGYEWGIDGDMGSRYLVQEWGYPEGIVLFITPSGGHDAVMLDYSECGPQGEPRVIYVEEEGTPIEEERIPIAIAANLEEFVAGLVQCPEIDLS